MIPIVIKGHERPITQLKYNKDGDILISTARDRTVSMWLSDTGERLGTLGPHGGSVMSVDIDQDSRYVVTGSADLRVHFWNFENGKALTTIPFKATARFVMLSPIGNKKSTKLLVVQDEQFSQKSSIFVFDVDTSDLSNITYKELQVIERPNAPYIKAVWSYDGKHILAIDREGYVSRINSETGEILVNKKIHKERIVDIQMSQDYSYFITSSRDSTAMLMATDGDFESMRVTYQGDVPLNTAAIAPIKDIVIAGGGIDAREVTTSSGGKFETHFFHKLFADDLGRVGGHFGPINTVTFHPHGTGYASGSEDGYVRIHKFDPSYLKFDYGKISS